MLKSKFTLEGSNLISEASWLHQPQKQSLHGLSLSPELCDKIIATFKNAAPAIHHFTYTFTV